MKKRGFVFVFFFLAILTINIGLVNAAYAEISPFIDKKYAGDKELEIKGIAIPTDGANFIEWKLELGIMTEAGEFSPTGGIITSSNNPTTNPQDQEYQSLYKLDISKLPIGEHALRLTARDSDAVSQSESIQIDIVTFYRSQPVLFTLVNNLNNKEFYRIGIFLYGSDEAEFYFVTHDVPFAEIIGNGDQEKGTVCKESCDFIIDMLRINQKYQENVDIELIAEDEDGNYYYFLQNWEKGEDSMKFETLTTENMVDINNLHDRLISSNIQINEVVLSIKPFEYKTTNEENNLKLRIYSGTESLQYDDYSLTLHYHHIPEKGEITHFDVLLTYPFIEKEDGKVNLLKRFVRGDADNSGKVDITDAIYTLKYLFQEGPSPTCEDALDSNDDGKMDITDAIYTLNYLFLGGREIPEPFKVAGEDSSSDNLMTCTEEY